MGASTVTGGWDGRRPFGVRQKSSRPTFHQSASTSARKRYILEATGNRVAVFDFDNDGLVDVFVPSASVLDAGARDPTTSHLYRNPGQLRFADVTVKARL
jgi:hypothetical protein